jgi:hypothetical protein
MTEIDPTTRFNSLNEQEKNILRGYCKDLKYEDIGKEVFLAEGTIKVYMGNIFEKLGVTHFGSRELIATIFTIYCPMLKRNFLETVAGAGNNKNIIPELQQLKIEEETPEPISEELLIKVEEVENKLSLYEPTTIVIPPKKKEPPGPNRNCFRLFLWSILVAIFSVVAFLFLGDRINSLNILDNWFSIRDSKGDSSLATTDLPEEIAAADNPTIIVVTATSPAITNTAKPTSTLYPTNTPIPSPTPVEDTAPGSILEAGEWWKEEQVWIRLRDYDISDTGVVYINLELWNKTGGKLYFQWAPNQNFSLEDNTSHKYPTHSQFIDLDDNEIIEVDELKHIRLHTFGDTTMFKDEYVFNPSVTELFLKVFNFSRIDEAIFRIIVNK